MEPQEFVEALRRGRMTFNRVTVRGRICLYQEVIKGSLCLSGAAIEDLDLNSAVIKGNLLLDRVTASGEIELNHASVEGDIYLVDTRVRESIFLDGLMLKGDLYLRNTTAASVFPGNDLALAIQCLAHFGKGVELPTSLARRLAALLSSAS